MALTLKPKKWRLHSMIEHEAVQGVDPGMYEPQLQSPDELEGIAAINIFPGMEPGIMLAMAKSRAAIIYCNFGAASGLPSSLMDALSTIEDSGTVQFVLPENIGMTSGDNNFFNEPDVESRRRGLVSLPAANMNRYEEVAHTLNDFVESGMRGEELKVAMVDVFSFDNEADIPRRTPESSMANLAKIDAELSATGGLGHEIRDDGQIQNKWSS